MDSKLGGLPLSAAPQGRTPTMASLSTSTGSNSSSFLIRAPPTVDSDVEGQENSNYTSSSYGSDSGFESEGFLSGEDGFETASERPFVADPDDETLQEGNIVDDSVVSGPDFTDPHGGFGEESVLGDGFGVSDEKPRSFVPVELESSLVTPKDEEGEYGSDSEPEVAVRDIGVPIAVVSWESDDDFEGIEEVDDGDEPIGGVRARVNVVEVEDEDEEQEFDSSVEENVVVDDGIDKLIEEKGIDNVDNSETGSYFASEDGAILGNSEVNNELADSVEEVPRLKDQGESELIEQPSAEETNDVMELESSVTPRQGTEDAEEAKFDSSKGSKDEDVEMKEDFAYSVREIEKLEIMEQQESETKDGEEDGGGINDNTLGSKLLEASDFPSVEKEAAAKNVEFDVAEVADSVYSEKGCAEVVEGESGTLVVLDPKIGNEVHHEVEDEAGESFPRRSGRFSFSDEDSKSSIFGDSDASKVVMGHLEQSSSPSSFGESSEKFIQTTQRHFLGESDEEEAEVKELFGSDGLTALLKAASASASSNVNNSHFAGLGLSDRTASEENPSEEEKKRLEKLQQIRVKFLRLLHRLGRSPEDSVAAQVLYGLVLAAGRSSTQLFSLESATLTALHLNAENNDDLDFSLNILVLGKTGVGKSATINSIFGEKRAEIDAFEPATASVKVIAGDIDGVKVRILDTPGLRSSQMEQPFNKKILLSVKKFTRKFHPDIVLYVDRLDTQARDLGDLPLLRSITSFLGSSIWSNAIITLTHAASTPPDGPSGSPLSHDLFVAQRSRLIQQVISQSMQNPSAMSPVSLIENHPEKMEYGGTWRSELLLLCYSMKILSEANSLERAVDRKKLLGFRSWSAPLLYFLSSLLQPNTHPKLPNQGGDTIDSDNELGDFLDSDIEDDEYDYDKLPPFKPLKRSEINNLSKEQRKAYFEEYDYRVRLLQKKQIKEELKNSSGNDDYYVEEESDNPATVAVPLPDMSLPPSFDAENPSHRYRFLEPTVRLVSRPVLDPQGWDHDCGYDGVSLETSLAVAGTFPAAAAVQITKDKKDFSVHFDSSVSAKHGESGSISTMGGFGVQGVGKELAYVVKGETKVKTHKSNRTACGLSVTFLGKNVATGVKIDDRFCLGKRVVMSGSAGLVRCDGDAAYGANLEVRVREKEFPLGRDETTLGMSLMRWRGEVIWGGNLESQVSVGRGCKLVVRAGLNNKLSGQVTVRTSSSDQLHIALLGIIPIAIAVFKNFFTGTS